MSRIPLQRGCVRRLLCAAGICLLHLFANDSLAAESIYYEVEKASNISLALYDANGHMVREAFRAERQLTGKHQFMWDGLNQEGQAVPAGTYTWKLLSTQGLEAEYLLTLGTSVGIHAWPGVHGGPSAAQVVGDRMYMAGAGSETAPGIACSRLDGTFVWSADNLNGWADVSDMAIIGDKIWLQYPDGHLRSAHRDTGASLNENLSFHFPVMALALQDSDPVTLLGWRSTPRVAYTSERGVGWTNISGSGSFTCSKEDLRGKNGLRSGHLISGSTGKDPRFFQIDVPVPTKYPGPHFKATLHLGGGAMAPAYEGLIQITAQGKKCGQWKTADGITTITFPVDDVVDGHITLGFSGDMVDLPWSIAVRGIVIDTYAGRMTANQQQMVICAENGNRILWVRPPAGRIFAGLPADTLPSYVALSAPPFEGASKEITTSLAGLEATVPEVPERILHYAFNSVQKTEISIDFLDERTHAVTVYIARPEKFVPHNLTLRVLSHDGTKTLTPDHEVTSAQLQDGVYISCALQGKARLQILGKDAGLNAIFFDPPAQAVTPKNNADKSLISLNTTTRGAWRGVYGSDGFVLFGDRQGCIDSADIPALHDVALLSDGSVLAISGTELVTLTRSDKTIRTRLRGLTKPTHLAVDPANGDILVTLEGPAQQILRLDRNYTIVHTYGRAGGRREGTYVATDFSGVNNIASDGNGGFLVAEWWSAPRRIAHVNRAGSLVREWLGGQMFFHSIGVDPEAPSRVWINSHFGGWVTEYAVDYTSRTSQVISTWNLKNQLDPVLFAEPKGFRAMLRPFSIMHNGTRHSYLRADSDGALAVIVKPDYAQGRLRLIAAAGAVQQPKAAQPDHPWRQAAQRLMAQPAAKHKSLHGYLAFGYADANDDGTMQVDEFTIWPTAGQYGQGWVNQGMATALEKNWNLWIGTQATNAPAWYRLAPLNVTNNGLPTWDIGALESGPLPEPQQGLVTKHVWPTTEALYSLEYRTNDGFSSWWSVTTPNGHGFGWPGTMLNETALVKRDAQSGTILWQSGPHHSGGPGAKGRLDMPQKIAGLVNKCIGVTNQTRQPCEFWTEDGLYVGGLFDRRYADGLPDSVYAWWRVDVDKPDTPENRSLLNYDMGWDGILAQLPQGDVLFFGAGWNTVPVYKIHGWEHFTRKSGTISLSTPALTAATGSGTGLTARYFSNDTVTGAPALQRTDLDVWFGYADKVAAKVLGWPNPEITAKPFSVRWTGHLEPRFSEQVTLAVYTRDAGVRLWLDDTLLIDAWKADAGKSFAAPVALKAGKKIPIRMEFHTLSKNPEAHLCWESLSQNIEHIPSRYLFPELKP